MCTEQAGKVLSHGMGNFFPTGPTDAELAERLERVSRLLDRIAAVSAEQRRLFEEVDVLLAQIEAGFGEQQP